jgi:hypothetical protein
VTSSRNVDRKKRRKGIKRKEKKKDPVSSFAGVLKFI